MGHFEVKVGDLILESYIDFIFLPDHFLLLMSEPVMGDIETT